MLSISHKRPAQIDSDLATPLKEVLRNTFPTDSSQQIDAACDKISNLRNEAFRALETQQPWDVIEPLLFSYYYAFTSLSGRVRFALPQSSFRSLLSKTKEPVTAVNFSFSYSDSLLHRGFNPKTGKAGSADVFISAADGDYERASILFTIAACMTQEAVRRKNMDPEKGLVTASKFFKDAAGILKYISTDSKLHLAGQRHSQDVSSPVCEFLSFFFLAQSQLCFFERAAQAKLSPATVAKLAAGAGFLFFQATGVVNRNPSLSAYFRSCSLPWDSVAMFQYLCLRATSNWWWSKPLVDQRMYGEEVGYLRRAKSLLTQTKKYDSPLVSSDQRSLLASRDMLLEAVTTKHASAEEDNAKVFFKLVPEDLPEVELIVKAEASSFEGPNGFLSETATRLSLTDPFSFLISPELRAEAQAVMSSLDSQASSIAAEATKQNDNLRKTLNELGLPASLDAVSNVHGLPADLERDIASVRASGCAASLARQIEQILTTGRSCVDRVQLLLNHFRTEQASDDAARQQYGVRWSRKPSAELTKEYLSSAETLTTILKQAQQSDFLIEREFKANQSEIERLETDVAKDLPQPSAAMANDPTVKQLQASLAQVSILISDRERAIEAFKASTNTSSDKGQGLDVLSTYIRDAAGRPTLLTKLSQFVTSAAEPLQALDKKQNDLLNTIREQNAQFVKIKGGHHGSLTQSRELALQRLNVATALAMKLRSNYEEGSRFYSELIQHNIEPFELSATDFLLSREKEYFMYLQAVNGGTTNYANNNPYAPPTSNSGPYNPQY